MDRRHLLRILAAAPLAPLAVNASSRVAYASGGFVGTSDVVLLPLMGEFSHHAIIGAPVSINMRPRFDHPRIMSVEDQMREHDIF